MTCTMFGYELLSKDRPYDEERDIKRRQKEKEKQISKVEEAAKKLKQRESAKFCKCIT